MKQISLSELQAWQASGKAFRLVDVREADERADFHIGGEWIPLSNFVKTTDLDTTQPIVVYCKRGVRSQIAIQRLSGRFPEAEFYNLTNGILSIKTNKNC